MSEPLIVPPTSEPVPVRKLIAELSDEEATTLRLLMQVCWVCFEDKDLIIDYGLDGVRGVLCTNCKSGVVAFKDSVENLRKAIKYLNR